MPTLETLIQLKTQIQSLNDKLVFLEENGGLAKLLHFSRIQKKISRLELQLFNKIDAFLQCHDPEYLKLVQSNLALLQVQNIDFVVYSLNNLVFSSHTKQINGEIHKNGFGYLESTKTNLSLFQNSWDYPSELNGNVNHWGEINLNTVNTGSSQFKNTPNTYQGSIDDQGRIKLKIIQLDTEYFNQVKSCIGKLIANHFNNDNQKLEQFLNNKQELKTRLEKFRIQLKTV